MRNRAGGRHAIDLGKQIDQRAVGRNHDHVAERLIGGARIVDGTSRFPRRSSVDGAGEIRRPARIACHQPVPGRVHEGSAERIGGDGVLVVEEAGTIADECRRRTPAEAAIGRAHNQHGVDRARFERAAGGGQAHRISRPIGRERQPGIRCAGVVAAVGEGAAAATRHRQGRTRPGLAAVEGSRAHESARRAVGPAILLPDADQIRRIRGIHSNVRLDLGVLEHGSGAAAIAIERERRGSRGQVLKVRGGRRRRWWWGGRRRCRSAGATAATATAGAQREREQEAVRPRRNPCRRRCTHCRARMLAGSLVISPARQVPRR